MQKKKNPTLPRSTFHNSLSYTFPIHSPIIPFSALTILLKCGVKQPSKTRSRSWLPSAVHINSSSLITREFFHTQKKTRTQHRHSEHLSMYIDLCSYGPKRFFTPFTKIIFFSYSLGRVAIALIWMTGLVLRSRVACESHVIPLSRCKLEQNTCALVTTSPGVGSSYHAFRKNTDDWTCGQPVLNCRCHVGI